MNDAEARARKAIRIGNILGKVKPQTWAHLQQSVTLEEVLLMAEVLSLTDLDGDPVLDFGELKGGRVSGDAFLGGMFGSLAGAMIDRKLRELPQGGNPPPPPMTEAERRAYFAKLKKTAKAAKGAKAKRGSSRS